MAREKKEDTSNKEVAVKFTAGSFLFDGVKYDARELESRAAAGDIDANIVIAKLVEIKAGVVSVEEIEKEDQDA